MYLKRYSMGAFLLMILVGWYVYAFVTHDTYSIGAFGINLPSVPIALLVVLPIFILYVVSILHMSFYSWLNSRNLKKYDKDFETLRDVLKDVLLQKEPKEKTYKTKRYKILGELIKNSKIFPNTEPLLDIEDEKLKEVIRLIHKIKHGEVVNLKKLSLDVENELMKQNSINRYKNGELSAEEILINSKNHAKDFVKLVFNDFVKEAEAKKIMKYYKDFITKKSLFDIVERVSAKQNELKISPDDLVELISSIELTSEEYIKISKILAKGMMPEDRLKVFKELSEKYDQANEAYLYTAFDLEMMDLVDEILESSAPEEYKNFRAYKALKECNQSYNIDLFV